MVTLCGYMYDAIVSDSHVLSWGKRGLMAVAFDDKIYVMDPLGGGEPTEVTPTVPLIDSSLATTPPRNSTNHQFDITAVEWDPTGKRLAIGNETGYIWVNIGPTTRPINKGPYAV